MSVESVMSEQKKANLLASEIRYLANRISAEIGQFRDDSDIQESLEQVASKLDNWTK